MFTRYQRARLQLIGATALSFALFFYAGRWFGIPYHRGLEDSLMQHPSAFVCLLVTAVVWALSVALSSLIAGSVRVHAGVACAATGLMALSLRGGPMMYVLQDASSESIFITLALEVLLLGIFVGGGFAMVDVMLKMGLLKASADPVDPQALPVDKGGALIALAVAVQMALMMVFIWLLAQSDKKGQVLIAVAIAAFGATAIARSIFAQVKTGHWYCFGPILVGVIGYLFARIHPVGWETRHIDIALARPLPLDYASAGIAATLLGIWIGARHKTDLGVSTLAELMGKPLTSSSQRPGK